MSSIERSNEGKVIVETYKIIITMGLDNDGNRCITTLFQDLNDRDDDGNPHLIPYFDGVAMIAVADKEFFMKHMLEEE